MQWRYCWNPAKSTQRSVLAPVSFGPNKKSAGGASKTLRAEWLFVAWEDIICRVHLNKDRTIHYESLEELAKYVNLEAAGGRPKIQQEKVHTETPKKPLLKKKQSHKKPRMLSRLE